MISKTSQVDSPLLERLLGHFRKFIWYKTKIKIKKWRVQNAQIFQNCHFHRISPEKGRLDTCPKSSLWDHHWKSAKKFRCQIFFKVVSRTYEIDSPLVERPLWPFRNIFWHRKKFKIKSWRVQNAQILSKVLVCLPPYRKGSNKARGLSRLPLLTKFVHFEHATFWF